MGGKDKKGQRTKGNVQPSSSGRSAELLGHSVGFIGFGGSLDFSFSNATGRALMPSEELFSCSLPTEFQVVVKKLSKKDVTTKVKALQEFSALTEQTSTDVLKNILPLWPRIYNRLALDDDQKVRECTQKANFGFVNKLGRETAPFLKEFIGVWFTSQCDVYPPASSAATTALSTRFPNGKLSDLVVFFHKDIIAFLQESLIREDLSEDQKERLLVQCFGGYSLVLQLMKSESLSSTEFHSQHSDFWKSNKIYQKAETSLSPLVKQAWCVMLTKLFQHLPVIAEDNLKQIAKSLARFMNDASSMPLPALWIAILEAFHTAKNIWSYISFDKCFSPKFLDLLSNACYGNAVVIGPVAFSTVRLLNERYVDFDMEKFNRGVVQSLCKGILSRNASPRETSALCSALFQVITYLCFKENNADTSKCLELLSSEVMGVYSSLLDSRSNERALQIFLRKFVKTTYEWFKKDEHFALSSVALLSDYLILAHSRTPHPSSYVIDHTILSISVLINPFDKKDFSKVSFRESPCDAQSSGDPLTPELIQQSYPILSEKIVELCGLLVRNSLKCFQESDCRDCLRLTSFLLEFYDFSSVLQNSFEDPANILQKLLSNVSQHDDGTCVAHTFFKLLNVFEHSLKESPNGNILNNANSSTCIHLAIQTLNDKRIHQIPVAKNWLRGERLSDLFLKSSDNLLSNGVSSSHNWDLLKAVLCAQYSDEPVVEEGILSSIVENIVKSLSFDNVQLTERDNLREHLFAVSQMLAGLSKLVARLSSMKSLCAALINLLCSMPDDDPEIFDHLIEMWKVASCEQQLSHCRNAILAVSDTLTMRIGCSLERVLKVLNELFAFSLSFSCDENSTEELCYILAEGMEKLMRKMTERNLCNLLAKEFLLGDFFPSSIASLSPFKSYDIQLWIGFIKYSIASTNVAINYTMSASDRDEVTICASLAIEVGRVLSHSTEKLFKENLDVIDLEEYIKILEGNLRQLVDTSTTIQQKLVNKRTSSEHKHLSVLWDKAEKGLNCLMDSTQEKKLQHTCEDYNSLLETKLESLSHTQPFQAKDTRNALASVRIILRSGKTSNIHLSNLLNVIRDWRDNYHEDLMYGIDLKKSDLSVLSSTEHYWTVIELIRILDVLVTYYGSDLDSASWDLILCSVSSWCTTLEETWKTIVKKDYTQPLILSFSTALLALIASAATHVSNLERGGGVGTNPTQDIVSEWNDVFSEEIYSTLLSTFLSYPWGVEGYHPALHVLFEKIHFALKFIPSRHINIPFEELAPVVHSKFPGMQLTAYSLMFKLIPQLASKESECFKEEQKDYENKPERTPPQFLMNMMDELFIARLMKTRVGDIYKIKPYSAECFCFLGYCLSWNLIINLCGSVTTELRSEYAASLYASGEASKLLESLFRVIPHYITNLNIRMDLNFFETFSLTTNFLQDIAVTTYASALRYLPALVRRWFNSVDKHTALVVEKFTSKHISPILIDLDLQFTSKIWDNMIVKVRRAAREVVATYKLNEEASMELLIQLPPSYPLGNTVVESGRRIGVNSNQWRNWMLQLTTFLTHQNGSIIDGLALWKRNVDKRFEGVEECYICYYVLHGSNYQLPKLTCRTCKKKFHADCLYKWFNTSTNSTCPLCRNLF